MRDFSKEAEVQLFDHNNKDSSLGFNKPETIEDFESKTIERLQGEKMEKLELNLTTTLYQKLCDKSKKEGVTVNELISELLAEGLVLRAWEIMERKATMKQGSHGNVGNHSNQSAKPNNRGFGRGRQPYNSNFGGKTSLQGNNRRNHKFSNRPVDDNANFIEYVRSQEKKNSW